MKYFIRFLIPKIKRQEFVGYAATLLQPYTQTVTTKTQSTHTNIYNTSIYIDINPCITTT